MSNNSQRAVLVAVTGKDQSFLQTKEYLSELGFLAFTLGIKALGSFIQTRDYPHPKTFVGKGKLAEIAEYISANDITQAIFDDSLSPAQLRHLEEALKCTIRDRNLLILDIFSMRAKTARAKIQVELAQYQYLLPRLKRMWTHLSRQSSGSGMRGPGEKELETDKRIVQQKITVLKGRLQSINLQDFTQRKTRHGLMRVALVGYTNAGKSTLMKALSGSNVYTDDKLFATLDATVRRIKLNDKPLLLADTVGFIRKLPHTLVECFKSTLDEVREANLLLHVVDAAHCANQEHIAVVQDTLQEIGAGGIPQILVFNKMDQVDTTGTCDETVCQIPSCDNQVEYNPLYDDLYKDSQNVYISAYHGLGLGQLRTAIESHLIKETTT